MYFCESCNYKTAYSSNFSIHKKSAKHIKSISLKSNTDNENYSECTLSTPIVNLESTMMCTTMCTQNYSCQNCQFSTKHKTSYYRHVKICKNNISEDNSYNELKMKLIYSEKEKDLIEKEKNLYQKLEKEKSDLLKDFMANANVLLNKANDNTKITAQAMQTVSVSALKYANDKFKDTPALLPLENFNINNLNFDNEEDKNQLTEILIYNSKQDSLDKILGDHIVKCYKKENPEEQSFHTTDCSRLNYIVRSLIENALTWSVDKNGIKICSSIIKPLIEKCIEILMEHQRSLIEEMAKGNYQNKETIQTILSVLMSIDKGSLESDINKYIAPFFNLNKN